MKKINELQKKIKSWYSGKKDQQAPGFDFENFRYKVANDEQESEFFKAIFGGLIQALSDKEFEIDLTSVYDSTTVEKNRDKVGEEIYQQVSVFQKKFIMHLKDRMDLNLLIEYLKGYNYYSDCGAIISFYKKSIAELYFGLLVRIETILSSDLKEQIKDSILINDHTKYVFDHLGEIIQYYIESIEYAGRFYFNENNYYEKMELLRINELGEKEGVTGEKFLKIHKEVTESLQLQKDLMKDEFPEKLKETLLKLKEKFLKLEKEYIKIVENNKNNEKLIKDCYLAFRSAQFIDSSEQLFSNFIRNKTGIINWTKKKIELLFFIKTLNEITNLIGKKPIYKFLCLHFTINGKKINYNPEYSNTLRRYKELPPKKNNQEFIKNSLMILENIKWVYT